MIFDAGEPGRDVPPDARDDGWIAGEFVAPAAGRIDEPVHRLREVPSPRRRLTYASNEADR
jgi:hypothetical protein